jgi:signal recognition particle subunit SEC65
VAEQRGGRVLRVDKDNEEKHATVVDFLDQGLEKRPPVLFAEVADGAEILHKKKGKGGGSGVRPEYPTIHIDGLNIILDTEEILRIVNERKIQETKKERIPLDQLKKEVRAAGINSIYKYTMARQEHRSWPSRPENTFKNSGWVSWSDFFGTKHRFEYEKISLEQLKVELVRLGVSTSDVYKELLSTHLSWPSNPHTFYKDWKGWPDLFGRDEKKSNVEKISFDKLKDEVKELGISTSAEYCVVSPRHPTWPAQPLDYYSKRGLTVSWNELFGKESVKKLSLEELKVAVRKEGVNSKAKYKEVYKLNSLWPSDPKVFYRDAWISWADLFGKSG